jgi:hypothetical protein
LATATNLPGYTLTKEALVRHGLLDGTVVHMVAALAAAFATVVANNPADVVRSRLYNQPRDQQGKGLLYRSAGHALQRILREEGFRGLYKGYWSHFMRAGPHYVITFVLLEQLRNAFAATRA